MGKHFEYFKKFVKLHKDIAFFNLVLYFAKVLVYYNNKSTTSIIILGVMK
jgi:hypothetical protein